MKSGFFAHGLMALLVVFTSASSKAQSQDAEEDLSPLLRVDSAFVWVPALVKTENGGTLAGADVNRFRLLDNGIPEKAIVINTDRLPISLVILMQTGGSASQFLSSYSDLPEMICRLIGGSVHEITLVTFDSRVEEIWHFPARTDGVYYALTHQHSGDKSAAIKDAVAFGVRQLQGEPGRFRRIVLLLSQGRDAGSSTSSRSLLEQLGVSSTIVYSLTFPGEKAHARRVRDARHTGAMQEASKRTSQALDDQTAQEVASLTGGTDYRFDDQRGFNSAMLETLSDFHDGITLGFQPSRHEAGFHRIEVWIDSPGLRVIARRAYWWAPPE
jgi:VWFA-related protein